MFFLWEGVFKQYRRARARVGVRREGEKGHSQTKWQHTVTGTTDITDTAEGVG